MRQRNIKKLSSVGFRGTYFPDVVEKGMDSHSRIRQPAPGPSFYCDNNVHRLGRSLRMLGYDTLLFGAGPDDELRKLRNDSGRILLSRDSDFLQEENTLVVSCDDYWEQLEIVVKHYSLDVKSHRYSLCLNCNQPIEPVSVREYADEVPAWLVQSGGPLWQCPGCRKLYWAGSHLEHMDARFDALSRM